MLFSANMPATTCCQCQYWLLPTCKYDMACRYEGRIVQQMIVNDGGKGEFEESTPPMLGIWETLLAVGLSPIPSQCLSQVSASFQQSAAMHEHTLLLIDHHHTDHHTPILVCTVLLPCDGKCLQEAAVSIIRKQCSTWSHPCCML